MSNPKKVHVLRIPRDGISLTDFIKKIPRDIYSLVSRGGRVKVALAFKINKKRRLKSFVLSRVFYSKCDCCGDCSEVNFEKNGKKFKFDKYFGIYYIRAENLGVLK